MDKPRDISSCKFANRKSQFCNSEINDVLKELVKSLKKPLLEHQEEEQIIEAHQDFYDKVLSENGVLA